MVGPLVSSIYPQDSNKLPTTFYIYNGWSYSPTTVNPATCPHRPLCRRPGHKAQIKSSRPKLLNSTRKWRQHLQLRTRSPFGRHFFPTNSTSGLQGHSQGGAIGWLHPRHAHIGKIIQWKYRHPSTKSAPRPGSKMCRLASTSGGSKKSQTRHAVSLCWLSWPRPPPQHNRGQTPDASGCPIQER